MKTLRLIAAAASLAVLACAFAQEEVQTSTTGTVTISSKGSDMRSVLHDLFAQSKRNYVLEDEVRKMLYLNLNEVEFDEAFATILKLTEMDYEVQNGIYYIRRAEKKATQTVEPPKTDPKPETKPPVKLSGKLPETALAKQVTTRYQMKDMREVFASLSQQTGVPIEVDISVPLYKIDAFLIKTSLKYALDHICAAAELTYTLTNEMSIRIAAKNAAPTGSPIKVYTGS